MDEKELQKKAMDQLREQMAAADSIGPGKYILKADGIQGDSMRAALNLGKDDRFRLEITGDTGTGIIFSAQNDGRWSYSREKRLLTLDGQSSVTKMTMFGMSCPVPAGRNPAYFSISIEDHSGRFWSGSMKDHHTGTSYGLKLERDD